LVTRGRERLKIIGNRHRDGSKNGSVKEKSLVKKGNLASAQRAKGNKRKCSKGRESIEQQGTPEIARKKGWGMPQQLKGGGFPSSATC